MSDLRGAAMPELPCDDVQALPWVGLLRMRLLRQVLQVALRLSTAMTSLRVSGL